MNKAFVDAFDRCIGYRIFGLAGLGGLLALFELASLITESRLDGRRVRIW